MKYNKYVPIKMDKFVTHAQVKLLLQFSGCINNVLIMFASNTISGHALIAMRSSVYYSSWKEKLMTELVTSNNIYEL